MTTAKVAYTKGKPEIPAIIWADSSSRILQLPDLLRQMVQRATAGSTVPVQGRTVAMAGVPLAESW